MLNGQLLKPVRDFNSYSIELAKEIYALLCKNIFQPLEGILAEGKEVKNEMQKGRPNLNYQGIDIHIEDEAGTYRHGPNYVQLMNNDYGYICNTIAVDGDELDCFVGKHDKANKFYVIEQVDPNTKNFDEYKVMFGFKGSDEAYDEYFKNYDHGWQGFRTIKEYQMSEFWEWYKTTQPPKESINGVYNAKSTELERAIRMGRIRYVDGFFLGNLNSALSKELRGIGARYNKTTKAYTLERSRLPQNIVQIIAVASLKNTEIVQRVRNYLTSVEGMGVKIIPNQLSPYLDDTIKKLDTQFHVSTKEITGRDLEIPIEPHLVGQIREVYTTNLDYYIKKFHDDEILRLRKKVERNVSEGFRAERLIDTIMAEKRMTKSHARFIAKQEVGLMTATYTELRYTDIGVPDYMWSTSLDSRVRPTASTKGIARLNDHRILHGRIFSYSHPPIVDSATGRTANPKMDYGCRCQAIPFLKNGVNFLKPKPPLERLTAY